MSLGPPARLRPSSEESSQMLDSSSKLERFTPNLCTRDSKKYVSPCPPKDWSCVVHDRKWLWEDLLLMEGLESNYTVDNVKERVSEVRNVPRDDIEVLVFGVTRGGGRVGDEPSAPRTVSNGSRRSPRRKEGPIWVCLWTPARISRDKRYLVTVVKDQEGDGDITAPTLSRA